MKSLRQRYALFFFFLIALMALPSAVITATAQPLLPQEQKAAVQNVRKHTRKATALPNDSTKRGVMRGPRRSWKDGSHTYYGIILDGRTYYYELQAVWNWGSWGDPYYNSDAQFEFDGYNEEEGGDTPYGILEASSVTIPETAYKNLYTKATGKSLGKGYSSIEPCGYNFLYDDVGGENYAYCDFYTQADFVAHATSQGWGDGYINEQLRWWSIVESAVENMKGQDYYNLWWVAMNATTLSFENEFIKLDATTTNSGNPEYDEELDCWYLDDSYSNGCLPLLNMWVRDGRNLDGKRSNVANYKVQTLNVPSKVQLLRWQPNYSATNIYMSFTPDLTSVNFATTENMRQIGGFKNHDKLTKCPINTLTGLKVIEAECFSGCTSLNIDSVDLRGMWVGAEAFNGVRATHLDLDHTNDTQNGGYGQNAKLYNVKCPIIMMHHDANHRTIYDARSFLKYDDEKGKYVLDDDEESHILVPCALYASYITDERWDDIADQIIPYNETEEDPCGYYVIIDGVRTFKDVAYSKDDEKKSLTLISVGNKSGRVLEIPHDFKDIFPDLADYTVQEIGSSVCSQRKDFKRLILPTTIKKIGSWAFYQSSIEYVSEKGKPIDGNSFPRDIKEIDEAAFYESALMGGLSFPYGIKKIDDFAFNQTQISSVYLPGSLSTAADDISESGGDIDFMNSKFAIGQWSFFGNVNLTSVYMDEGINGIAECAFQFNPELVSIHVPNSMRYIGGHFCCAAWKMQSLTIPAGVTDIDGSFLHGCESMRNVYLLGPPSMLRLEHIRSGCSFGPVDPILEWDKVEDYYCKHVNNCTFWVNDLNTYYSYINFVNMEGKKPWLRLDRFDMPYNLYGSNNPDWIALPYYNNHINDFPVNEEVYADCAAHMASSAPQRGSRRVPEVVEGRTTLTGAYLQTGYHNTYNYFDATATPSLPDPASDPNTPGSTPKDKWSTICFPFKPVKSELDALIGSDAIIAEYVSARLASKTGPDNDPECMYELSFHAIDHGDIEVNTPYLIRPTTGQRVNIPMYSEQPLPIYNNVATTMTADRWTDIVETAQPAAGDPGTDVQMIGKYLEYKLAKAEFYLKNTWDSTDNAWAMTFYKAQEDNKVTVNPFKCFFRIVKGGIPIKKAHIGITVESEGNNTTIIESAKLLNDEEDYDYNQSPVYDLSGRKLADHFDEAYLPDGVYIINGKKVAVSRK